MVRFYAICSPPSKDTFEFIIKEAEANAFLINAKAGEAVEMSLPQGKGYQIQEYFEKYKFDFPTTNVYSPCHTRIHSFTRARWSSWPAGQGWLPSPRPSIQVC